MRTTFRLENLNLTRKNETTINRLRIEHSRLTHIDLMSNEELPICEVCGSYFMIKYILTGYQRYKQEQINFNMTKTLD